MLPACGRDPHMTLCCYAHTSGLISPKIEFAVCSWCGFCLWQKARHVRRYKTNTHLIARRKEVLTRTEPNPGCFFCSNRSTFVWYFPLFYSITAAILSAVCSKVSSGLFLWCCLDLNWWNDAAMNVRTDCSNTRYKTMMKCLRKSTHVLVIMRFICQISTL